jgi:hypothetical protein
MAQNPLPREYSYDAAGNRIGRTTPIIDLTLPAPPDSSRVAGHATQELSSPASFVSPDFEMSQYFVEKIAQVEMKIYPNPTTEKITFEIVGGGWVENFRPLQLFTMNGQLLQTQPVHSSITEVSLAGLAKGTYILKVQIDDTVEDWKIIKQ